MLTKSPARVFGNTLRSLRSTTILALMLAVVAGLALYFFAFEDLSDVARTAMGGVVAAALFAVIVVTALATCLFTLRIDETRIAHVFGGRFVLTSLPLSELTSIQITEEAGALFRIRDGRNIRFLTARVEVLRVLNSYLEERRMQGWNLKCQIR